MTPLMGMGWVDPSGKSRTQYQTDEARRMIEQSTRAKAAAKALTDALYTYLTLKDDIHMELGEEMLKMPEAEPQPSLIDQLNAACERRDAMQKQYDDLEAQITQAVPEVQPPMKMMLMSISSQVKYYDEYVSSIQKQLERESA